MRVNGRILRPSNLAERRILKGFGLDFLHIPRSHNPFAVARQIQRLASGGVGELRIIKEIIVEEGRLRPVLNPVSFPFPLPSQGPYPAVPGSSWCSHAQAGY